MYQYNILEIIFDLSFGFPMNNIISQPNNQNRSICWAKNISVLHQPGGDRDLEHLEFPYGCQGAKVCACRAATVHFSRLFVSKFWHVRNPLPQSIRLRLSVLVRYWSRPGGAKFILDVLRWTRRPAHISLPCDHCPGTQHS